MAAIRLDRSVQLRVVFGNSIEHDHELAENTAEHADDRFAFLSPTVSFSYLLLQDLVDRLDFGHELCLNLFA